MFTEGEVTEQAKHGVHIQVEKPTKPKDYRPTTLLKNDYKLMAQIIASQLRPTMAEFLLPCQYCGVPGNSIFEAVATLREARAHAEVSRVPLCILSMDFQEGFDKVSHTYLFTILHS